MGEGGGAAGRKVLKKIYFIKKAREGEELTTLLKNKFKSIDAIRDLLSWFEDGRDFVVSLTLATTSTPGEAAAAAADKDLQRSIAISPWLPVAENHRNLVEVIAQIIYWLDVGRDFDIVLAPTQRFEMNLN